MPHLELEILFTGKDRTICVLFPKLLLEKSTQIASYNFIRPKFGEFGFMVVEWKDPIKRFVDKC